jgi:mono/diheme cytochrome c family protein
MTATTCGLALFGFVRTAHSADTAVPDLTDPKTIWAGHDLYLDKHCSHCHGATGEGGVNLVKRDLTNPSYVFEAIADGRERGGLRMPAWREVLSDQEIWQITAYVISLSQNPK